MNFSGAIVGGVVGGTVMIGILYPMLWMLPRQMKMNLLQIIGTMLVGPGAAAYAVGFMMHMMMSIVFGLVHGGILEAADVGNGAAALGLALGLGHALIVGMVLGMMPMMHPRMRISRTTLLPVMLGPAATDAGRVIDPPGFFALNYPMPTVMGFFMLHAAFGIIVGAFYSAL